MLNISGTPDFTSFGEFMISLIHYAYITEFVSQVMGIIRVKGEFIHHPSVWRAFDGHH